MEQNEFLITKDVIKLNQPNDILFAKIAQQAIITGAILPSGYQVPKEGTWIIKDEYILNVDNKDLTN